jgi:MoaA/NifB/PqqE/SkfB family radical SAM enzyme
MKKTCNYYVTFRSNDTCEFCPIWQDERYKNIEEKPYDLNLLKKAGVKLLNITGGEPLLREDLPDTLKEAKELGVETQLATNGILYPEKARLLDGLIDRLFVSLDYPFAEEHDRSRGVECFNEAIKSIKLASELGEGPIIKFTMTRDSVRFLPEMIELAEKLNVLVYLDPVYDFFGTQGFEKATLSYIRYYSKRENVLADLAVLSFVDSGGNSTFLPRCRAKQATITILPDGSRVTPCFFNQGGKQGRETICSSCMRWPYLLPSFASGMDKYFFLNLYSNYINNKKELNA